MTGVSKLFSPSWSSAPAWSASSKWQVSELREGKLPPETKIKLMLQEVSTSFLLIILNLGF